MRSQPEENKTYFSRCLRVVFRRYFEVMNTVIEAFEGEKAVISGSDLEMKTSKTVPCAQVKHLSSQKHSVVS